MGYPLTVPLETEIKLRLENAASIRKRLRKLGFRLHARRVFESNTIFDFPDKRLCEKGELIRIRKVASKALLTYKGPPRSGPHKSREEIETTLADAKTMQDVFKRLELTVVFRYEKYRAEYARPGIRGIVTVDETPIGNFLEIEGPPKWIDSTARELGYARSDYITMSYSDLYLEHCRECGIQPSHMTFSARHRRTPER